MNLGESQKLDFLRSGPYMMSLDPICMLWRHGRCLLVKEEDVAMEEVDMGDVFFLGKSMWLWEMSSGWRRAYGHGRCFLVGGAYMAMKMSFSEDSIWIWKMPSCWRRIYGYGRCLPIG